MENHANTALKSWTPGAELTVLHAETERRTLLELLSGPVPSGMVDLSAVTQLDTAGIQLMLSWRRSLADRAVAWEVTAYSDIVRETLAVYGLDASLLKPSPAQGATA